MPRRRAKGEGSVYKDKQGYWNAQIVVGYKDGKKQYKRFRSKSQAEVLNRVNTYKLEIGKATKTVVNGTYLEDLVDTYVNNIKRLSVRATTLNSVMITAEQIRSHIGHYIITDLTPEIIQIVLVNKMFDENYAHSTIHKALILLNECMRYAVEKDYITKNPCSAVKLPNKENFENKDIRFLTDEEIEAFKIQANILMKGAPLPKYIYGNILCLILYTGLRIGELCGLKWSDVDFEKKRLRVNKAVAVVYKDIPNGKKQRTLILQNTTKSGKPRTITLNSKAIEILQKQRDYVGGSSDDFIVNGSTDIVDKGVVGNSYGKIARAAKIPNPTGVHTLRHTFASSAIRKGANIKVVSEILGHASTSFTYNTYVHIIDDQKFEVTDLLEDL